MEFTVNFLNGDFQPKFIKVNGVQICGWTILDMQHHLKNAFQI